MADKIQMWELTQSQYNNLETKDPYTFYKTFDNNVYLGEILLSNDEVAPSSDDIPAYMQWACKKGIAQDLWSVGDSFPIELNGTVGIVDFSNETYYAFIIGFDHNDSLETNNKHSITLQFGKMESGTDIAFIDSNYGSTGSTDGFRINTSNTNVGGWESCYMKNTICPAFYDALPSDWQKVIGTITKYQDNTGNSSNTDAGIWNTNEQIFLLAEYEVFGSRTYANTYEQNYQQQYDYYAAGNSRIKYRHSATSSTCNWWSRSANCNNRIYFCGVNISGIAISPDAYFSYGLAPAFAISEESDVTTPPMSYWTIILSCMTEDGIILSGYTITLLYNNLYISWDDSEKENNYYTYTYKDATEAEPMTSEISLNDNSVSGLLLQKIPTSSETISLTIEYISVPDGYNKPTSDTVLNLSSDGNNVSIVQQAESAVTASLINSYTISITQIFNVGQGLPSTRSGF